MIIKSLSFVYIKKMKTRVKAMWGEKIEKELTPKCIFQIWILKLK